MALLLLFFGDFGQLPPVRDRQMFDKTSGGGPLSESGRMSFSAFDKSVILKTVERVRGNDNCQQEFRKFLSNLRNGQFNDADYRMIMSRHISYLTDADKATFKDAPYLVSNHNDEVREGESPN